MLSNMLASYLSTHPVDQLFVGRIGRKASHVKRVAQTVAEYPNIFLKEGMDMVLLQVCAEHHDDSRAYQYEKSGVLNDTILSHQDAGAKLVQEFCTRMFNTNTFPEDVRILMAVMKYHGRLEKAYQDGISGVTLSYVEAITIADRIDLATSCLVYLPANIENNESGFQYEHTIKDVVWENYQKGHLYDLRKVCTTYDEYMLFAATICISCLLEYGDIMKKRLLAPGFGYGTILEGYHSLFEKYLLPADASKAYKILENYVLS